MTWFTDAVDMVEDAANAIAEMTSDLVETAGKALEHATWRAQGTPVLGAVLGWLGGVVAHTLDFAGATVKGALGFAGGTVGGVIRTLGGALSLNEGQARAGLIDIGSSFAGGVIVIAGKAASLVQSIFFVEARGRGLTAEEIKLLRRVFRNAIAYYNVRLVEGRAGLFGLNPRPFALGNTVYLKDRNVSREPDLLVHEITHVWQYQRIGARYTSDALGAQFFVDDAYNWEKEVGRGKELWARFNPEAQASFLQDAFSWGELVRDGAVVARGGGAFFDADGRSAIGRLIFRAVDHTARADTALALVRARAALRLSGALGPRPLPMLLREPD